MIIRVEEYTKELTEYERDILLPAMVRGLRSKIGKSKAITNNQAIKMLKEAGYEVSDTRWRKVVHAIRCSNLVPCLLASSAGYYIATEREDAEEYLQSLDERIRSIQEVRNSLEEQIRESSWSK